MRILSIFGTRPEAIKMAPLVMRLAKTRGITSRLCVTAQHRELLDQVLTVFGLEPDYDLNIMKPDQTLGEIASAVLKAVDPVLADFGPDIVLVHGDTSTTFFASLAAFYRRIAVGHVEAGLRTGNLYAPWPEEANRKLTGALAGLHFAPTQKARANLLNEGVRAENIFVTGNTVIDSLLWVKQRIERNPTIGKDMRKLFPYLRDSARLVLITGHRRENFNGGFENICKAIRALAQEFTDVDFLYPVHLNPNVHKPVHRILSGLTNVHLIGPQSYLPFVWLMKRSFLVLTDSGGIQEEAPALGKPVLVMRETTERPEAVKAGTAKLVGADCERIIAGVRALLTTPHLHAAMSNASNPFGNGKASAAIVAALLARKSNYQPETAPAGVCGVNCLV